MLVIIESGPNKVRVQGIDGEPQFLAKDVCAVLDLEKPRSSCALLDDDEKDVHSVDTPGGEQKMLVISESGLYSLVLRSRKENARAFRKWITSEVIPSIRKTGVYMTDALAQAVMDDPKKLEQILLDWADKIRELRRACTRCRGRTRRWPSS
jgi:anti-repressor protein